MLDEKIEQLGLRVLVIWECQTRDIETIAAVLIRELIARRISLLSLRAQRSNLHDVPILRRDCCGATLLALTPDS